MAKTTRRWLTDDERAERRARDRLRLEQAARELLSSEGWRRWIEVRARNGLARYSLGNQLLVALQAPDARFVAGFHAWKDLGRRVSKGERGIRILAPMPLRGRDAEEDSSPGGEDQKNVRTLFKSVAVFDVAQTEPLPGREPVALEAPSEPITGESHVHLLAPLQRLAGELGYRVEQRRLDGAADGWCDSAVKRIVVNAALPGNARVRVLVHELAHALGVGYADHGRARAEVLVDCVTYVVLGSVGLDVSGETVPYIAGWGECGELDAVHNDAKTIDRIAKRIETALTAVEHADTGETEPAALAA